MRAAMPDCRHLPGRVSAAWGASSTPGTCVLASPRSSVHWQADLLSLRWLSEGDLMGVLKRASVATFLVVAFSPALGVAQAPAQPAAQSPAQAPPPAASPAPPPMVDASANVEVSTGSAEFFNNYSLRLGLESGGPLLFRDAPDGRVEETTAFQFGGRLAGVFGHELKDTHRGGLGVSYLSIANAESRSLAFIPVYLMYETGQPLILQGTLGANLTAGTKGFKGHYAGVHTGLALRYSFRDMTSWSDVMVSPGIAAKANLATDNMEYSSVFLGAQVEIMYDSNN